MGLTAGTGTALQHHEQGFSTRVSKTARKGQQRETVYPRLKPAKEEQERQERGERDALCSGQAVHQHLLHHEYNKKHMREPGSNMLESCPLDFR